MKMTSNFDIISFNPAFISRQGVLILGDCQISY